MNTALLVLGCASLVGLAVAMADVWLHRDDYSERGLRLRALAFGAFWWIGLPILFLGVLADPVIDRLAERVVERLKAEIGAAEGEDRE